MVSEDSPDLELGDRMFDSCPATSMPSPRTVADDAAFPKHRRDQLGDAAVAAVGEDTPVSLAESLHERAAIVDRIVAIAATAGRRRDDSKIATPDQNLGVTGPAVVLRS